ncbi:MAG TPA: protein kinase, partial [Candidatus Krumholzibacteria bacterium]|nr:protein kinase [Candidatus Krumholzibacteria bacterium]
GVVHRDIKSDNIVLTPKGQVKVLDFGLARGRDAAAFVTRIGSSAGTPAYMSPEHIQGAEMDARSDLFSFGVVLYEMLTGRMPFKGEHEAALTYSIVNETPTAIHTHNQAVPRGLENIVAKLLEKNPKDRYQGAVEVIEDLRRLEAGQRVKAHPRRRSRVAAAVVAGVLVPLVAFWLVQQRSQRRDVAATDDAGRKMLAVLPFQNLGPTDQEYFADGITEEITTQLAKLSGLGVISRTSAMKYKGSNKSLREIGKELGVDYVLEGSVRWDKSGAQNNVRVSTQLIRIADDTHLWADNFDRVYDQIFALQSEIAQKVASELNVTLVEPERAALAARPTKNLDAYDLYLRGRAQLGDATTTEEMDDALVMVEQAVAMDSTFARAQAFLARTYANQHFNHLHPELPRVKQARAAALAAVRHAGDQPAGHIAMGYYYYYAERDYDRALGEFEKAAKRQPNDADVLEAIAYVQRRQNKWDASVANLERAIELDPTNANRITNLIQTLGYMRRWTEAEQWATRGREMDPRSLQFPSYLAVAKVARDGDTRGAGELLDPIVSKHGAIATFRADIYIMARDYEAVRKLLPNLRAYPNIDTLQFYVIRATASYFDGDHDTAKVFADSALAYLNGRKAATSSDADLVAGYASVLAMLERREEALRAIDRAVSMMPIEKDALAGADIRNARMIVYIAVGDYEAAIKELEFLMSVPSNLTPAILRMHPGFDPLRDNPRFKKLAEEKVSS